jgi:hypothetical protein
MRGFPFQVNLGWAWVYSLAKCFLIVQNFNLICEQVHRFYDEENCQRAEIEHLVGFFKGTLKPEILLSYYLKFTDCH